MLMFIATLSEMHNIAAWERLVSAEWLMGGSLALAASDSEQELNVMLCDSTGICID